MRRVTCQIQYVGQSSANSTKPFNVAFGLGVSSASTDADILQFVFAGFNHGSRRELNLFLRAHIRSLSVGDFVAIDSQWYECDRNGWKKVDVLKVVAASV